MRSALTLSEITTSLTLVEDVDLIILATVSPTADRVPALINLLPGSQIEKPFSIFHLTWMVYRLLELVLSLDVAKVKELRAACDYEELDLLIVQHLIG